MVDKLSDPIGRLMGLRYKSHPWHGISIGERAPEELTAFIEVVPTDTVKYEIDKRSGYPHCTVLFRKHFAGREWAITATKKPDEPI